MVNLYTYVMNTPVCIYRIYLEQVPAVWRFNYTVVVSQEKLYFQLNEIPYLGKRTVVPLMKERTAVFYPVLGYQKVTSIKTSKKYINNILTD